MADIIPSEYTDTCVDIRWVRIALDVPLADLYDYRSTEPVAVGDRVIVAFGRRKMIGVVISLPEAPGFDPSKVKEVLAVLKDIPPLSKSWLEFATFAAEYYQRPLGEVILPALPMPLRSVASYQGKRSGAGPVARLAKRRTSQPEAVSSSTVPQLNSQQEHAVAAVVATNGFKTFLLYGVTEAARPRFIYMRPHRPWRVANEC
jgi:primosomal protein N' (replication factor Y)